MSDKALEREEAKRTRLRAAAGTMPNEHLDILLALYEERGGKGSTPGGPEITRPPDSSRA